MENERMTREDYLRCDRVWQRVAPELDPYPEVRSGVPAVREEAACCPLGGPAAEQLAQFIEQELAGRRLYLGQLRCAPTPAARKILRQIADEEAGHIRRLMGLYYMLTGRCHSAAVPAAEEGPLPWCRFLRLRYHAECAAAQGYRAAAASAEPCLQAVFAALGEDEFRHAQLLLRLLEGNLPASLA